MVPKRVLIRVLVLIITALFIFGHAARLPPCEASRARRPIVEESLASSNVILNTNPNLNDKEVLTKIALNTTDPKGIVKSKFEATAQPSSKLKPNLNLKPENLKNEGSNSNPSNKEDVSVDSLDKLQTKPDLPNHPDPSEDSAPNLQPDPEFSRQKPYIKNYNLVPKSQPDSIKQTNPLNDSVEDVKPELVPVSQAQSPQKASNAKDSVQNFNSEVKPVFPSSKKKDPPVSLLEKVQPMDSLMQGDPSSNSFPEEQPKMDSLKPTDSENFFDTEAEAQPLTFEQLNSLGDPSEATQSEPESLMHVSPLAVKLPEIQAIPVLLKKNESSDAALTRKIQESDSMIGKVPEGSPSLTKQLSDFKQKNRMGINEDSIGDSSYDVTSENVQEIPECKMHYTVEEDDCCWSISHQFDLNLPQLEELNPGLSCNSTLKIGQELCVQGLEQTSCIEKYTVKAGDSCCGIASNRQLTLRALLNMNKGVDCDDLQEGQQLCTKDKEFVPDKINKPSSLQNETKNLPPGCITYHVLQASDDCSIFEYKYGLSVSELKSLNPELNCNQLVTGSNVCVGIEIAKELQCVENHLVSEGNSCADISQKIGLNIYSIQRLNPGFCENFQIGQSICLKAMYSNAPVAPKIFQKALADSHFHPPVISKIPTHCGKYHLVKNGESCRSIASKNGLSLIEFNVLNPYLQCHRLIMDQVVCISEPMHSATCTKIHVVKAQDTCLDITKKYGISFEGLRSLNTNFNCTNVEENQVLCIEVPREEMTKEKQNPPVPTADSMQPEPTSPAPDDNLHDTCTGTFLTRSRRMMCTEIARDIGHESTLELLHLNPDLNCEKVVGRNTSLCINNPARLHCGLYHVVEYGETMKSIASKYQMYLKGIQMLNPGINDEDLNPGQQICVQLRLKHKYRKVAEKKSCNN